MFVSDFCEYLRTHTRTLEQVFMKWHLFLARVSYTRSGFSVGSIVEYRCDVDTFEGSSLSDVVTFFIWYQHPPVGQGLLIHEVSRSHTKMHHSQ